LIKCPLSKHKKKRRRNSRVQKAERKKETMIKGNIEYSF